MKLWFAIATLAGVLLSGCSVKPKPSLACSFSRIPLTVPGISAADAARYSEASPISFSDAVQRSLEAGAARSGEADHRPALLSLSGGSLNGAYGAGYLDEWKKMRKEAGLPRFEHVSGISTGAILATFAFTGHTEMAVTGYSITREDQLLKPYVKFKDGDLSKTGYVKMLKQGSLGDLAPLRGRLNGSLTDEVLEAVAEGEADGRTLFVGVVDVDTGEAEALDLTDMAKRWSHADDAPSRNRWKACYVEAIIASSSAPMAAAPVFIDNRMYMDGGARFGMFAAGFQEAILAYTKAPRAVPAPEPVQYLIINGDQLAGADCRVADKSVCTPDNPTGGVENPHKDWNLLKLALRSEKILANQVYRFSEAMVTASSKPGSFQVTKIKSDVDRHSYTIKDDALGSGTETCENWRKIDRATLDPIQFAPRYMWCLIDYGRSSARKDNWAEGSRASH